MSEKKMTKTQTTAWLVGQYQLCLALAEDLKHGYDIDARLNDYLKTIGEEARKNDNITLMLATVGLRQDLNQQHA